MKRRREDEPVQEFRIRQAKPLGEALRIRLVAWAAAARDSLLAHEPEMPEGVNDRAADNWEPLLTLAEVAGGVWTARGRAAAVAVLRAAAEDEGSLSMKLLADIRDVFDGSAGAFAPLEKLASAALVDRLVQLDESPWAELPKTGRALNQRGLARWLRPYEIRPHVVRIDEHTPRGFERADFEDAWERYLRTTPSESATPATPQQVPQQTPESQSPATTTASPTALRSGCGVAAVAAVEEEEAHRSAPPPRRIRRRVAHDVPL
jgi:hypothetical protein